MRASDVIRLAITGVEGLTDKDLKTACPGCAKKLSLATAVYQAKPKPTYKCPKCAQVLMVIETPALGIVGYRFGDYMLCGVELDYNALAAKLAGRNQRPS